MISQVIDIDMRRYANAGQPKIFGRATTDFFAMQDIAINRGIALTAQAPRRRPVLPRPQVVESLERSLAEHGETWAELAKR